MIVMQRPLQSLLNRYISSRETEERELFEELGERVQSDVRRRVARWRLDQGEDVCGECVIAIFTRIHAMKSSGERAIDNLDGLIVRTVENKVNDEFRKANPARRRVAYGIEQVLAGRVNVSGMSAWEESAGRRIVGFDSWRDRPHKPLRDTMEDPRVRSAFAKGFLARRGPRRLRYRRGNGCCAQLAWFASDL